MKKRVLVAMSGGNDSTATAILLKEQGYELTGVMFNVLKAEDFPASDVNFAAVSKVAGMLDFPAYRLDLSDRFRETVIANFMDEYLHGRTPNPCTCCNKLIKWGELLKFADEKHCDYIATGHYAQIVEENGRRCIGRGVDPLKDQSYFLWKLRQEDLARTIFPLGGMTKAEARKIVEAHNMNFITSRKESQEICFVQDNNYRNFLREHIEDFDTRFSAGNFVDRDGKVLGQHKGFPNYTIGQRKKLGIALGQPMFVLKIDSERNEVTLGPREEVFSSRFTIKEVNSMRSEHFSEGEKVMAKIRYKSRSVEATLHPMEDCTRLTVELASPIDSVTPGQSAVFYDNKGTVLGGGVIE